MKAREIVRRIEKCGGEKARQSGGHAVYKASGPGGSVSIIVPIHPSKEVPNGTVRSIEKQGAPAFGEGWLK